MQIFTRSPRRWFVNEINQPEIDAFNLQRKKQKLHPLIIHIPYLPNLATSDDILYKKSIDILKQDLTIAEKIFADYFIIHAGAYSFGSNISYGIERIAGALNKCIAATSDKITLLLENVSGGGRRVGSTFTELKAIIDGIKHKNRIGICIDTAHIFTAGYAINTKKGLNSTISQFDKIIGLKFLKVIHLNDSAADFKSKIDRHQHIGKGYIGLRGFGYIVNHPALKNLPFILETPKDTPQADKRNLWSVKKLIKP